MRSSREISLPKSPGMELLALAQPSADADESQKAQNSHLDWSRHSLTARCLVATRSQMMYQ